jgi:hypothetical protein
LAVRGAIIAKPAMVAVAARAITVLRIYDLRRSGPRMSGMNGPNMPDSQWSDSMKAEQIGQPAHKLGMPKKEMAGREPGHVVDQLVLRA